VQNKLELPDRRASRAVRNDGIARERRRLACAALSPVLESGRPLPDSFCSRPTVRYVTQKPTLLLNQGFFRHQM
jgi:hypothetical protein